MVCLSTDLGKPEQNLSVREREREEGENVRSYVTGNLPGCPGGLERDGVQPEVIATIPDLFPRVSVDFLVGETKK